MTDTVSLNVVQAQADVLGIDYHHRAGAEKIAGLVAAHLAANPQDALKLVPAETLVDPELPPEHNDLDDSFIEQPETKADGAPCPVKPMTPVEFRQTEEGNRVKGIGALRRVQISCMNPMKREWPGEIISVGSAKHGTFKKFVPFTGVPYHIPQIIYDALKERQCTLYRTERDERGNSRRVGYQTKEFNIVDLPPLTKEELEKLRKKQQLAKAGL